MTGAGRGAATTVGLLLWAACQAAPAPSTPPPPPATPPSVAQPPPPPHDQEPIPTAVGPAPLRRLSRVQYANTLRDLLGVEVGALTSLVDDPWGPAGFEEGGVPAVHGLRGLMETAETVAAAAVANLPALLPCDPATGEARCVRAFVAGFGRRAFRRPLAGAELDQLLSLYRQFRDQPGYGLSGALRVVLTAILQSPRFLYHWEDGCPGGARDRPVPLCPHALAARLSYFLWQSLPDQGLVAAAETGGLGRAEGLAREARRLLSDPRARDTIGWFHRQWLDLGPPEPEGSALPTTRLYKVHDLDVAEQAALLRAMDRETWEFAAGVLLAGDGRLETLLAAPFSFVDERLARFYGGPPPADRGFSRVALPHRAGILTHGSFLWTYATQRESHPIKRGKVIFERVLCGDLPPPPAMIPAPKPIAPTTSTRQRYAEHGNSACARGCHALIDPLGFALESFDAMGRYRAEDGGQPVDTSGVAELAREGSRPFADTAEFLQILSRSEDARRCLTRQWYRFALGRPETAAEEPALEQLHQTFARAGFDVRELLVAIAGSPSFRYRPPENAP